MPSNREIARSFNLFAELLDLHGKEEKLSDWLAGASYRISRLDALVLELSAKERAEQFRPAVIKLLGEIETAGTMQQLEELIQLTPSGLFDMMRIKGLGGKKLGLLWKKAKIENVEELLCAAKAGKISKLSGFGKKTEQNIIAAIEDLNSYATRFYYAEVAEAGIAFIQQLRALLNTQLAEPCGEFRRQSTTVEAIEVLVALPSDRFTKAALKRLLVIDGQNDSVTTGHTIDELPVSIYHTVPDSFYSELFYRTGTEAHVNHVLGRTARLNKNPKSEQAIYKAAGLPFIEPELREDIAEWEYVKNPKPLITFEDIKGVVHNHTDWSDGVDRLENFVAACKNKGYEYVVVSDHSQNAHYAGGLKPDKVLRQFQVIDRLNKKDTKFKIFKSIECDILVSGELDYDPSLLLQFDLVIVSVHQQLKMNEKKATDRLIKAIENPFTTIVGHMTGRQLLIRPGYPLDFKKVIDACAANHVIIEVNANPYRLDMDWSHIPYALEKGVMISINPDAHSIHEIDNIRWGISAARKGGLTKDMTWNAMGLRDINKWLKANRGKYSKR